jgi:release factor glutamine methyltransferase
LSLAALISSLRERLAGAGVPSPEVDAELLIAAVMGISRGDVRARALRGDEVSTSVREAVEPLVVRRSQREPLQHLLGVAPFMTFELEVGPGVFVPRPETESLVEHAIRSALALGVADTGISVVDVCSGSGAIAIAIAREVSWARVQAVEVSPEAHPYLRRNVAALAPEVEIVLGSVQEFGRSVPDGSLDMIVSNPPYVPLSEVPNEPEVSLFDPALALYGGDDGLDVVRDIIDIADRAVRPGGVVMVEHSNLQGGHVALLMREKGFRMVSTEKDLVGRDRFTHAVVG